MKDRVVTVRLNTELFNMLQLKSSATNLTPSEYIRQCINDSDIRVNNDKDIARIIASINRVGNNINQISHNLNIAKNSNNLKDIDYDNILDKLVIIEYQLNELLKGV